MKDSIKDELRGKTHELKGAVKEMAGQVTDNSELESEGHTERVSGKVQKKLAQLKRVFGK